MSWGEEEGLFKAKAMNEVDAGRDRATPAYVENEDLKEEQEVQAKDS